MKHLNLMCKCALLHFIICIWIIVDTILRALFWLRARTTSGQVHLSIGNDEYWKIDWYLSYITVVSFQNIMKVTTKSKTKPFQAISLIYNAGLTFEEAYMTVGFLRTTSAGLWTRVKYLIRLSRNQILTDFNDTSTKRCEINDLLVYTCSGTFPRLEHYAGE